jgi:hypothetical protein
MFERLRAIVGAEVKDEVELSLINPPHCFIPN